MRVSLRIQRLIWVELRRVFWMTLFRYPSKEPEKIKLKLSQMLKEELKATELWIKKMFLRI